MTLAEYLLGQWLPAKEATLAPSTHARDVTSIEHYLLPHLGDTPLRRLQHRAPRDALPATAPHRQPARWTARREDHHEPPPDHPLLAQRRRRSGAARVEPRHRRTPAGPAQAPSSRRRARSWTAAELGDFLTDTADEPPLDAVPAGRRDRDAPRRGARPALGRRPLRHRPHRESPRRSRRSATDSSSPDSRPAPAAATSPSTSTPSPCSPTGGDRQAATRRRRRRRTSTDSCSSAPNGKPLHPHSVSQAFDRAQRPLDVSPIRFHDLRHTHASLLLRDRVPIKVVSERLGHSNPAFTMTTYQHVLPGMQDDAAAAFGATPRQPFRRSPPTTPPPHSR